MTHDHSNPVKLRWNPLIERWVRTIARVGKGYSIANLLRGPGGYSIEEMNGSSVL